MSNVKEFLKELPFETVNDIVVFFEEYDKGVFEFKERPKSDLGSDIQNVFIMFMADVKESCISYIASNKIPYHPNDDLDNIILEENPRIDYEWFR